jgi:hypothetical protein
VASVLFAGLSVASSSVAPGNVIVLLAHDYEERCFDSRRDFLGFRGGRGDCPKSFQALI